MTEIEQTPGNPDVPEVPVTEPTPVTEPDPYVIDPILAARIFWTGVMAGESHEGGRELAKAFVGAVATTYPSVERHEDTQRLVQALDKVKVEARRKPSG